MRSTWRVEVGQPSSPDGLIGRSPKSARMRHTNKEGKVTTKVGRKGRKGGKKEKQIAGMRIWYEGKKESTDDPNRGVSVFLPGSLDGKHAIMSGILAAQVAYTVQSGR